MAKSGGLQDTIWGKGIFKVGLYLAMGGIALSMLTPILGLHFPRGMLGWAMIVGVTLFPIGIFVGLLEKRARNKGGTTTKKAQSNER